MQKSPPWRRARNQGYHRHPPHRTANEKSDLGALRVKQNGCLTNTARHKSKIRKSCGKCHLALL
eukprot:5735776-Amphidinium_carterae.1